MTHNNPLQNNNFIDYNYFQENSSSDINHSTPYHNVVNGYLMMDDNTFPTPYDDTSMISHHHNQLINFNPSTRLRHS